MIQQYIPVLLLAMLALAFAVGNVLLSFLFGPRKDSKEKLDPYECGMPPIGNPRERFNVKFFLVAMVFVIFDIEIVFLFLWAAVFQDLGIFGLIEMAVFLGVLVLALAYVWEKGVLEWASKKDL
ncbi:NADH-quinone oxidoreductase subunit A [bacterium]|nr:NADH-quinone oxidoreductase subunit A [bacterium]